MKTDLARGNGGTRLVSVVVGSIRNAGRVLLVGPDGNGCMGFPSEEFDGSLNGSLMDTMRRTLGLFIDDRDEGADFMGSFVAKRGNVVEVVYNFSVDASDGSIRVPHIWSVPGEMEGMELDFRTAACLKSFGPSRNGRPRSIK